MTDEWLQLLETPCIVVDLKKVKQNIRRMQAMADSFSCRLRPHIKTHKSVEIARMQVAAGAEGITCAKISEAEVMADGGLDDIFIAYPLLGDRKQQRALALHRRVRRLILAVDSYEGARALSEAAAAQGVTVEVRLEIDTGAKRTGVLRSEAVALAKAVAGLPALRLTGLYTFKSLLLEGAPTLDAERAGQEECTLMNDLRQSLQQAGLPRLMLSVGSTPTAAACAQSGLVDEIRPGTYVFNDLMTHGAGACAFDDIAAYIITTVVSTPDPVYAVLDGGSKVFPTDVPLHRAPYFFTGYARAPGYDHLILDRLSEEHGMLTAAPDTSDTAKTGLTRGQRLALVPVHICTAINLRDYVYAYEDGNLRKLCIDARGMSV